MYNFVIADFAGFNDFYKIKSEQNSIYWSGFALPPDYLSFREHYKKELDRDDRVIVFLYIEDEISGYIAIDFLKEIKSVETSHGVLSCFSGRGLGKKLINYAVEYSKKNIPEADYMIAWIAEGNIASIKNFITNGYSKTEDLNIEFLSKKIIQLNSISIF